MMMRQFMIVIAAFVMLASARTSASDDLLARMAALNPDLHAYTATLRAHVIMTSLLGVSTDLVGTYYYKDPDRAKLVITSGLPGIASQFSKLYPHIVAPSRWQKVFVVTRSGDDGTLTHFALVPRVRGNVDHIDAYVDDRTATTTRMRWSYDNGGWAEMNNSYSTIDGNILITAQTGHVEEPYYKGNVSSTLGDYQINPDLSDSIFEER